MIEILPKSSDDRCINEDDVIHYYCPNVYPNADGIYIAFCGMDVTDADETDSHERPCSMCMIDMDIDGPCPACGSWDCD